jgi:hypothetical protein
MQWTVSPVVVAVLLIRSTMTWWVERARPRQLRVIWENSRCSILFHLLVPGGRWQTVTCRPVSAAKAASSIFQARVRLPLEPPLSAQMSSCPALDVLLDQVAQFPTYSEAYLTALERLAW